MRSITTVIQYIYKHMYTYRRTLSFQVWTRLLTLVHGDTRRETQFLKVYANHTMLTPLHCVVHLVVFKISISRDLKIPTSSFNGQNPTLLVEYPTLASMVQSQLTFSKSTYSQDHLFRAWHHPHSNPISCLVAYYDKWWLLYPLRVSITAPVLRDSNSSKPYQTEW